MILIVIGAIILLGALAGAAAPARRKPPPPPLFDDCSPTELAAEDPVEALLRYGTPDDAARLAEQGVDLHALGYRAPGGDPG